MFFRKSDTSVDSVKPKKKEEESTEQWDKKRIIISAFFVIVAIFAVNEIKTAFFPSKNGVLGQATQVTPGPIKKPDIELPRFNVVNEVGSKINEIKNNINSLDPKEVASSSPQIQKVLRDMEGIKDLPSNEAKSMCMKICSEI